MKSVGIFASAFFILYLLVVGFIFGVARPIFTWYILSTVEETEQRVTEARSLLEHSNQDEPVYNIPLHKRVDNPGKHNKMTTEIRKVSREFNKAFRTSLRGGEITDKELLKKLEAYLDKVDEFSEVFPDAPAPVAYKLTSFNQKIRAYDVVGKEEKTQEVIEKARKYIANISKEHLQHEAVSSRVKKTKDLIQKRSTRDDSLQ